MAQYKEYKGCKVYTDGTIIGVYGRKIGTVTPNGYIRVSIQGEKINTHQLIMKLFVGEANGFDINHKNGLKTDNRLENLEYVTRKENIQHAWTNGLCKRRYNSEMHTTKISDDIYKKIKNSKGSEREVAKIYNVSRGTVNRIRKNKQRINEPA